MRTAEDRWELVVIACIFTSSMQCRELWIREISIEFCDGAFVLNLSKSSLAARAHSTTYACALPRMISLRQQVMRSGPLTDTASSFQSVLTCRSEVNATVYPAQRRFLSCILARRKAAEHAGKKI